MRGVLVVLLASACGRLGFDATGDAGKPAKDGRGIVDAAFFDAAGTMSIDAPLPPDGGPAACASFDLGSALGPVVAASTRGRADMYSGCQGGGSPDISYAWTAPATAKFTMSLCNGPDQSIDTTLSVRDGTCSGPQLACDDDGCGSSWLSKLTVNLSAGQLVIIIVDGNFDSGGRFALTITQN